MPRARRAQPVAVTDTRMLSATGQALFAGARVVDRQIEVKIRDKRRGPPTAWCACWAATPRTTSR